MASRKNHALRSKRSYKENQNNLSAMKTRFDFRNETLATIKKTRNENSFLNKLKKKIFRKEV